MYRFENKYDLMQHCYQDNEIKRTGKALMQYLVYISNKQHCFPAVETIAHALSVSTRTVQRHMRTLEERGYIIRKARYYNHEQLTNQYVFNFGVTTIKEKSTKPYPANQGPAVSKVAIIDSILASSLKITEKTILTYLTHICNKAGYVRNTLQKIAERLNISVLSVKAVIHTLIRKGLLKGASVHQCGQKLLLLCQMRRLENSRFEVITCEQEDMHIFPATSKYDDSTTIASDIQKIPGCTTPVCPDSLWMQMVNAIKKSLVCIKNGFHKLVFW